MAKGCYHIRLLFAFKGAGQIWSVQFGVAFGCLGMETGCGLTLNSFFLEQRRQPLVQSFNGMKQLRHALGFQTHFH